MHMTRHPDILAAQDNDVHAVKASDGNRQPDGLVWLGILLVALFVAEGTFFTVAHLLPDDRLPEVADGDAAAEPMTEPENEATP